MASSVSVSLPPRIGLLWTTLGVTTTEYSKRRRTGRSCRVLADELRPDEIDEGVELDAYLHDCAFSLSLSPSLFLPFSSGVYEGQHTLRFACFRLTSQPTAFLFTPSLPALFSLYSPLLSLDRCTRARLPGAVRSRDEGEEEW